jgi:Fic family protein
MSQFSPIAPIDKLSQTPIELIRKAETVLTESSALEGSYPSQTFSSIRELFRMVNSYYSNKIESEHTTLANIEKAMRSEFSDDSKNHRLQTLSLAHINTQKHIEAIVQKPKGYVFSEELILDIHKNLYSQEDMKSFLTIEGTGKDGEKITRNMSPGKFRDDNVKVGYHIPPSFEKLNSIMQEYENMYSVVSMQTHAMSLIYLLASHHRLMWIHPFLDGNGRVSRLVLDYGFYHMGIKGYGLWNISRGLSRSSTEYKRLLSEADSLEKDKNIGKGPLSYENLLHLVDFMLDTCIDQINYMKKYLNLSELPKRIKKFYENAQNGLLDMPNIPKNSDKLLIHLLYEGECSRGDAGEVLGLKRTSSAKAIKELEQLHLLVSDSPKGKLRLGITTGLAKYLFPELTDT